MSGGAGVGGTGASRLQWAPSAAEPGMGDGDQDLPRSLPAMLPFPEEGCVPRGVWGSGSSGKLSAEEAAAATRATGTRRPSRWLGAASQLPLLETCPGPGPAAGNLRELCHGLRELPVWAPKGRLGIAQPRRACAASVQRASGAQPRLLPARHGRLKRFFPSMLSPAAAEQPGARVCTCVHVCAYVLAHSKLLTSPGCGSVPVHLPRTANLCPARLGATREHPAVAWRAFPKGMSLLLLWQGAASWVRSGTARPRRAFPWELVQAGAAISPGALKGPLREPWDIKPFCRRSFLSTSSPWWRRCCKCQNPPCGAGRALEPCTPA